MKKEERFLVLVDRFATITPQGSTSRQESVVTSCQYFATSTDAITCAMTSGKSTTVIRVTVFDRDSRRTIYNDVRQPYPYEISHE